MREITRYLKANGYNCMEDSYYRYIELWQQWYRGKVTSVHSYTQYNGRRKLHRTRKSLGLGKTVSEDWANLLLNEQVKITLETPEAQKAVDEVLQKNGFRSRGNQLIELTFAMGTGAFVEFMDGDKVKIDYIRAGMIYPLAWDNGQITECAFASARMKGKTKRIYLNIHRLENERYVIENHMLEGTGGSLREVELPEGVEPTVDTKSSTPRFQILTPNLANNIAPDSPMGIAVIANALDQLEGTDLAYDSYCNEFRLGKKRVTIPLTMARIAMEEDGTVAPVFDDADTEFYAVPAEQGSDNKITEHNMEIRADAHDKGIQTMLSMVSWKCGFGQRRYIFSDGQVKTATEVISNNSDLYRNLRKHELKLEDALQGLIATICELLGIGAQTVTVTFDDSIIEDAGQERVQDLQDVRDGLMAKWEYRKKWYGEDETTAKAAAAELEAGGQGLTFGA